MIEAISCGGVVIFRGKILLLYKNYRNRYEGWVLPKGTVEQEKSIRIRQFARFWKKPEQPQPLFSMWEKAKIHLPFLRIRSRNRFTVSDDGRKLL